MIQSPGLAVVKGNPVSQYACPTRFHGFNKDFCYLTKTYLPRKFKDEARLD